MSDTFQCAKCGAKYARERRRVGRAVVCACGHKFLVPPPDDEPAAAGQPTAARPDDRGAYQGGTIESAASDSSSEVLPLAELADDDAAPARWAEPVEDEVLPEAEIVYATPVEPAYPVDDLFASGGAYGDLPDSRGGPNLGRYPPAIASVAAQKKRSARRKRSGTHKNVTDVIASIALLGLLPIGALLFVLGFVQYLRLGRLMPVDGARAAPPPPAFHGGFQPAPPLAPRNAGGMPILVVRVTKKPTSDNFTLEYDVRHGALNPGSQYVWVVSSLQGKIEFQIPTPAPGRGQISGRPAQAAGLSPPYTAYIEEQSASGRTRVSNEVAVGIGG